jgi:ribosomal protein S18 acetylase RimI-like enzyme
LLFALPALRERGLLLLAWQGEALVGTVIVASAASPARQVARADEAEIHLLAVDPDCRRSGLGAALMHAASEQATRMGFARLVLSTQTSMAAAHRLYKDLGYSRNPARDWRHGSREFHVYEKQYLQKD